MTGAAALGALVPAVVGLLYACRALVKARAAAQQAQAAAELATLAGQSAGAAHDRLDALSAPPAPAGEASPPPIP